MSRQAPASRGSVSNSIAGRSRSSITSMAEDQGADLPSRPSQNDSRSAAEQRKARKREQDRLCQRRKREKDRENLRKLEARLDGLQNSDDPKVVLDLLLQREKDQAKLERQGQRLRQIEALLHAGINDLGREGSTSPGAGKAESQDDDSDMFGGDSAEPEMRTNLPLRNAAVDIGTSIDMMPNVFGTTHQTSQLYDEALMSAPMFNPGFETRNDSLLMGPGIGPTAMSSAFSYSPNQPTADNTSWAISSPQRPVNPPSIVEGQARTWLSSLNQVRCIDSRSSLSESMIDQHVIITVVVRGWDVAASQFALDPIWLCLRQLDEAVFINWNWRNVDRLVSLLLIRMQMKGQVMGGEAYSKIEPAFLRPRPSQVNIPHPPNADYFPWPGVRERFVFDSAKYSNDNFLKIFGQSTRFLWPFKFSDMFRQDGKTRLMQFSPELTKRVSNVNCWTIDSAFLHAYPEFMGDLPTFNSVPGQLDEKPFNNGQPTYVAEEVHDVPAQEHGYTAVGFPQAVCQQVTYGKWNYGEQGFVEASVMG